MSSEAPRAKGALKRIALDMSAMVLFLVVVMITDDIYLATGVGIVTSLARVGWEKIHRRPVDQMQWASLALIAVLGTATMLTHDPRFVKLKPTIVDICIGVYMLRPGWCAPYLPKPLRDRVPRRLMVAWGYVWALAMFALAGSNFLVEQVFGQRIWAAYVSISPMVLIVVLSAVGIPLFVVAARKNRARAPEAAGMK